MKDTHSLSENGGARLPAAETDDEAAPGRKPIRFLIKLVLAAALLFFLFRWDVIRLSDVRKVVAAPLLLAEVGSLIFLSIVVTIVRWRMLLASQGMRFRFHDLFHIYYISLACAPILPGGIGGDAVRIGYIVRMEPTRKVEAAGSVIIDRALAMVGLCFLAFAAMLPFMGRVMAGSQQLVFLAVAVALIAGVAALIVCACLVSARRVGLTKWLQARFDNRPVRLVVTMLDALALYRQKPGIVAIAIGLGMFNQIIIVIAVTLIGWRLGFVGPGVWEYGVAAPLTQLVNVLPVTPGGIGVGEAAFDQILRLVSAGTGVAAGFGSIFLAYRAFSIIVTLPGIISYLCFSGVRRKIG